MADWRGKKPKPKKIGKSASKGGSLPKQSAVGATSLTEDEPTNTMNSEDQFERELVWCVEQLHIGLTSGKTKPESKQGEDSIRILKILQNPKAPLIKKRQAMRNKFGDYRKKMQDEEKLIASSVKKASVKCVEKENQNQYTFLKKCSQKKTVQEGSESDSSKKPDTTKDLNLQPDNLFKFDFNLGMTSSDKETAGSAEEEIGKIEETISEKNKTEKIKESDASDKTSETPAVNYWKMNRSDNSFKFDFSHQES